MNLASVMKIYWFFENCLEQSRDFVDHQKTHEMLTLKGAGGAGLAGYGTGPPKWLKLGYSGAESLGSIITYSRSSIFDCGGTLLCGSVGVPTGDGLFLFEDLKKLNILELFYKISKLFCNFAICK